MMRICTVNRHQGRREGRLKSPPLTPLNWPRGEKKPSNSKQGSQCIMSITLKPNTMELKGVSKERIEDNFGKNEAKECRTLTSV